MYVVAISVDCTDAFVFIKYLVHFSGRDISDDKLARKIAFLCYKVSPKSRQSRTSFDRIPVLFSKSSEISEMTPLLLTLTQY